MSPRKSSKVAARYCSMGNIPYHPTRSAAVSGSEIGYAATRPFKVKGEFSSEGNKAFDERLRCEIKHIYLSLWYHSYQKSGFSHLISRCLRARYAMFGTGIAYAATAPSHVLCARYAMPGTVTGFADAYRPSACYAMSGTDVANAATRQRDPSWGYRDVAEVQEAAKNAGMELKETIEVPMLLLETAYAPTRDCLCPY
eukprot:1099348-Rhodomonas_salina.1